MKDERIEQAKNKIRSEITVIIFCGVAISFLVKMLVFNMNIQQCMTEYLILILSPLYQFIRMHMMKISIYNKQGNKKTVKILIVTIIFLVIAFFVNSKRYNSNGSIVFIPILLAAFVAIATFFIVNKFNKQMSIKYDDEFNDETDDKK